MNTKNCKEELIDITISLINDNKGDVDKVTIRDISAKSGVSIGLINYHFGNKDNLITECVKKIITKVVKEFKPNMEIGAMLPPFEAGKARLIDTASKVFDFFFAYTSISRISILNDHSHFTNDTNSYFSIKGFSSIIGDAVKDRSKKELISFSLASCMQVTFLKTVDDKKFLDYDFSIQEHRNRYITDLIDILMEK